MAQKRRFLDVWIVETDVVYREVPFMVVTDWIQQGRLLGDDRVRPSGTREWYPIGESPTFAPYMPKIEEHRAEDQAEALEPVQIDFAWQRRPEEADEDVDMIPLIDVSLVLLIFFMMTASVTGGLFDIDTPTAKHKNIVLGEDMQLWVGIDTKEKKGDPVDKDRPWYSLGLGSKVLVQPTQDLSGFVRQMEKPIREELMKQLDKSKAKGKGGTIMVRLRADQSLPIETIKKVAVRLKQLERTLTTPLIGNVQLKVLGEVRELRAG